MNWIELIISFIVGGGLVAVFTIPQKIRAERLANDGTVASQWKELAEKNEQKNEQKSTKIDTLSAKINKLQDEVTRLGIENARLKIFKCATIGCMDRKPPFGSEMSKKENR